MADVWIKVGDTLPIIRSVVKDEDGVPIDIQDADVSFALRMIRGLDPVFVNVASNDQVTDGLDGSRGKVSYAWDSLDTIEAGPGGFYGEWRVVFVGDAQFTAPDDGNVKIAILDNLGNVGS